MNLSTVKHAIMMRIYCTLWNTLQHNSWLVLGVLNSDVFKLIGYSVDNFENHLASSLGARAMLGRIEFKWYEFCEISKYSWNFQLDTRDQPFVSTIILTPFTLIFWEILFRTAWLLVQFILHMPIVVFVSKHLSNYITPSLWKDCFKPSYDGWLHSIFETSTSW